MRMVAIMSDDGCKDCIWRYELEHFGTCECLEMIDQS